MTVTFRNAPLIEMIAELRWGEAPAIQQNLPFVMPSMGPDFEQFFMRFGGEVYQHGFQRTERLVPAGFPVFPYQPVFRYRRDASGETALLFQVGSGVFTANATPPYRSWKTVQSSVRIGVESMLKVRRPAEINRPFNVLSLRYINAFGPELTGGRDIATFARDVLGFDLKIPDAIIHRVLPGSLISSQIQFNTPLADGTSLSFLLGEGAINGEGKILLDMTVTDTRPTEPDSNLVMSKFTDARSFIHQIFIDLTKPIANLLEPIGDDDAS
jgi:uncharacterized protein (TIGR04255 family)